MKSPAASATANRAGLDTRLDARRALDPLIHKTDFGILRYVHFLATAYVAWLFVGPNGINIRAGCTGLSARVWMVTLGFAAGVRGWGSRLGFAAVTAVAYGAGCFKSQPWKRKA